MSTPNRSRFNPDQLNNCLDDLCPACNQPDQLDGNIVVCSRCKRFFHINCVPDLNSDEDQRSWKCGHCLSVTLASHTNGAALLGQGESPRGGMTSSLSPNHQEPRANSVTSSQRSARKRYQLQLAHLEEERSYHKSYLEQKYEILKRIEQSSTCSSIDDSEDPGLQNHDGDGVHIDDGQRDQANTSPGDLFTSVRATTAPRLCSTRIDKRCPGPVTTKVSFSNSNPVPELLSDRQMAARHVVPKDLPPFSGDPADWAIFISSFEQSTSNCGYTHQENMIRLQRCLKGDALLSVRSILLMPDLVPEVIRTLRMRFGRPDLIIMTQINMVRAEPTLKPENIHGLINFALVIRNLVATIEASGLIEHRNNPTLLYEIIEKLPVQTKLDWAKYKYNAGEASLLTFSHWLYELAEAASCVVSLPLKIDSRNRLEAKADYKSKGYAHNTHAIETHQTSSSDKRPSECCHQQVCTKPWNERPKFSTKCYCCQKTGHTLPDCEEFLQYPKFKMWRIINYNHLCALCLVPHRRCPSTKTCGINGCRRRHHSCLHSDSDYMDKQFPREKTAQSDEPAPSLNEATREFNQPSSSKSCNAHRQLEQSVLFRVLPVTLHGSGKKVDTFAFLDDGSSLTIMEEGLARELQLEGPRETLCLKWTGGASREERDSRRLSLSISAFHGEHRHELKGVRTVSSLGLPIQSLRVEQLAEKYSHLKGVPLSSYNSAVPRILIGLDNWRLAVPTDIRESNTNEPIACKTRLGWVIAGSVAEAEGASMHHHLHICDCQKNDADLNQLVRDFYALDSYGITKPGDIIESSEDRRSRQILCETTKRLGKSFETGLLWRYDEFKLPDSWKMAMNRLNCLERKMNRDHALATNVRQQIGEYLSKGYIRKLTPEEAAVRSDRTWFLPIFTVRNHNKPNKIRIVWDAAAKVRDISLNSVLMKGPDLMTSLPDVLWRFRERRVAITGDIKQMFHQVAIRPEDREAQRFLWRDGNIDREPEVYEMLVMTFGATCSPCSAHYIKNLNASDFEESHSRAVRAIVHNHYVDDLLDSVDTEEEAMTLAAEVKFIHSQGGFEMRNWRSNSLRVSSSLGSPNDEANKTFSSHLEPEKVLGMLWNTSTDSFCYSVNRSRMGDDIMSGKRRPSKREVLKVLMMIFDPMGLIAHYLVFIKTLMQDVWRSGIQWDEQLKDLEYQKWLQWIDMLPLIENLHVPRCYLSAAPKELVRSTQIHMFVDASEKAYAAVAYLRIESLSSVSTILVGAKTKVAPL